MISALRAPRMAVPTAILCIMLSAVIPLQGCSTNWINVALQDLPVLVQIAVSILGIVSAAQGNGTLDPGTAAQITNISNQVKSDLMLIQTLVAQYKANAQPALLSQIDAALGSVQGNLQAILQAAHINNVALQTTITTSISLALTVVVAIQSLVPVPPSPSPTASRVTRLAMKPMEPSDIKRDFNSIVNSHGYGQFAIQ